MSTKGQVTGKICLKKPLLKFLSTNDVVTAALNQAFSTSLSCMCVDMRGRHPDAGRDCAGNYDRKVWFDRACAAGAPGFLRRDLLGGDLSYFRRDQVPRLVRVVL